MASRVGPVIIQLIVFYVIISFIVRLIRKATRTPTKTGKPGFSGPPPVAEHGVPPPTPAGGLRREERLYNGVVWYITHRPRRDLSVGREAGPVGHDVYVEEAPRCPKCRLGVIESHSWLGYKWSCPACGSSWRSSHDIHSAAEILARHH
jgi:hypothetical protein